MEDKNKICIVGISGSMRKNSCTSKVLQIALEGAQEVGAEVKLIELNDYNLVFCHGDEKLYPPDVHKLRKEVENAHGIILGTPEYHGGYSGSLKNALDLMGFQQFEGKMLGLVGVSGGKMGASNALMGLRVIGRALHAWVVPQQASIPEAWKQFNESGNLFDAELYLQTKKVGQQVAKFSFLHNSNQSKEFLQLWQESMENPGARNNED